MVVQQVPDTAPDDQDQAIRKLVDLGRDHGYVTYEDITRVLPEAEDDLDLVDELFAALTAAGVVVVDQEEETDREQASLTDDLDEGDPLEISNLDIDDSVGLYLKVVGRVPLLTAKEEVDLAKRIRTRQRSALPDGQWPADNRHAGRAPGTGRGRVGGA